MSAWQIFVIAKIAIQDAHAPSSACSTSGRRHALERQQLISTASLSKAHRKKDMGDPQDLHKRYTNLLVGQTLVSDASSSKNTVAHDSLPAKRRICPPGTMMTRDFHEDRLNVFTDKDDKVTHVTVG